MNTRLKLNIPLKGHTILNIEKRDGVTLINVDPDNTSPCSPFRPILQAFPDYQALAMGRTMHVFLVDAFLAYLGHERRMQGDAPLGEEECRSLRARSISLFYESGDFQIRPDDFDLALEADRLLQRLVPSENITFLGAHEACKKRGMLWRCAAEPLEDREIVDFIQQHRVQVGTPNRYFYNQYTGARYLTLEELSKVRESLDNKRIFLERIAEIHFMLTRENRLAVSELALFELNGPPPLELFNLIAAHEGDEWAPGEQEYCAALFDTLLEEVRKKTPVPLQKDDYHCGDWIDEMFEALRGTRRTDRHLTEHQLGIGPEFHHHVKWLPGARFVDGELEMDEHAQEIVRGLIRNYIDLFGRLEYINIGNVKHPRTVRPRQIGEERSVYIVAFKQEGKEDENLCVVRKQKWGVSSRIVHDKDTREVAQRKTAEYTQFIEDRLDGLHALGVDIPDFSHFLLEFEVEGVGKVQESFWRRGYIHGVASDKIPSGYMETPAFRRRLAELLGKAAGVNIIIGRQSPDGRLLFNDGDEIVEIDSHGMPLRLVLCETTGSFANYDKKLSEQRDAYAQKLEAFLAQCRKGKADGTEIQTLREIFLRHMREEFLRFRAFYRAHKEELYHRFDDMPYDSNGNFHCRWKKILDRLDQDDIEAFVESLGWRPVYA